MTKVLKCLLGLSLTAAMAAQAKENKKMEPTETTKTQTARVMKISKPTELPATKGSADFFTGDVTVAPVAQGEDPSTMGTGYVCFQCKARSAWHTHPKGQLLVVTDGEGLIQEWGKPIQRIRKGDVIWTPPGVKHWHGATPEKTMCHLSITESINGKNVDWMEKVSDDEYGQKPADK
jgi:quercetin dioxygenase-like cupin family protein